MEKRQLHKPAFEEIAKGIPDYVFLREEFHCDETGGGTNLNMPNNSPAGRTQHEFCGCSRYRSAVPGSEGEAVVACGRR